MESVNSQQLTKQQDNSTSKAKYVWLFGVLFAFLFVFLIWFLAPNLKHFTDTLVQRNDLSWYYWKLPSRNFWTMNTVWGLYLANQISIWAIIYFAQKNSYGLTKVGKSGLAKYTLVALAITVTFVFLHLLETQALFDGLAQDVPIITSQGSVIIMLSIILIIEIRDEACFWAKKPENLLRLMLLPSFGAPTNTFSLGL